LKDEYKLDNIHYLELSKIYPRLSKKISDSSKLKYFFYFFWMFFAFIFLCQVIKKYKPSVLHGGYVPNVGLLCALTGFRPFLLMPWGSDILIFPDISFLHKFLIGNIIRRADAIVCDAETVKVKIMDIVPNWDETTVFPWGIDLKLFQPQGNKFMHDTFSLKDLITIISTRNHESIYGIEILLESFRKLVKINNNVRLVMLGSGSLTSEYLKYIEDNKLKNHIKLVGKVANSDLPKYLSGSDIYVSASFSDGTSVSLLEAMACRLPVIVSDIPANREWISNGDNGFLFERGNSEDLLDKMVELINNPELIKIQSENNHNIASQKANWNNNFKILEKVYKKITC